MFNILIRILMVFFGVLFLTVGASAQTEPKSKVNLDDVKIKGQSNFAQGGLVNRDRMSLESRIKKRKDFREEILENLPENYEPL